MPCVKHPASIDNRQSDNNLLVLLVLASPPPPSLPLLSSPIVVVVSCALLLLCFAWLQPNYMCIDMKPIMIIDSWVRLLLFYIHDTGTVTTGHKHFTNVQGTHTCCCLFSSFFSHFVYYFFFFFTRSLIMISIICMKSLQNDTQHNLHLMAISNSLPYIYLYFYIIIFCCLLLLILRRLSLLAASQLVCCVELCLYLQVSDKSSLLNWIYVQHGKYSSDPSKT